MPAQSEKQRGLMGLVHSIQQGKHPNIKNNKEKVMKLARDIKPDVVKDFLKKECDEPVKMTSSPNKTSYSGTPPLSSDNNAMPDDATHRLITVSDLIDPDTIDAPEKVAKTIELPDKMIKKFLYLLKDTSHNISEATFNGQIIKLYKPFKLKNHPSKKYGIYIKSLRDSQIIKVIFGTADMTGDPLRKKE